MLKFRALGHDIRLPELSENKLFYSVFSPDYLVITPQEFKIINLKISADLPKGYYLRIEEIINLSNRGLIYQNPSFIPDNNTLSLRVWNRVFPVWGDKMVGIMNPTGTVTIQKNELICRLLPVKLEEL